VAGTSYQEKGDFLAKHTLSGASLRLVPEFNNPHDKNAVMVYVRSVPMGHIPKADSALVAKVLREEEDSPFSREPTATFVRNGTIEVSWNDPKQ
jgi:hypothetical protein